MADDEKREELDAREAWLQFTIGLGESDIVRRAAATSTDKRVREMHDGLAQALRRTDPDALDVRVWTAIAQVADIVARMEQTLGSDGTTWEASDRVSAADLDEIGIVVRRRSGPKVWVAFPELRRCASYDVAELSRPPETLA